MSDKQPPTNLNDLFDLSDPRHAAEGLRLVKAFLGISDAHLRSAVVEFLERLSAPKMAPR